MRNTSIFAVILAAIVGGTLSHSAQAAETCDLTALAAELATIQSNTSLGELESLNAEILARRRLLSAAIDCDQQEIAARVSALGHLPDNVKILPAYRGILEDLASASRYYDNRKNTIQTMGLWDLKVSARDISAWRKETYLPAVTWADNLLIWEDNQQFLERASERLTQVSRVAFSLQLVNQDEVNVLFEKARSNFDTAIKENDMAKESLNQKRPGLALAHTQASLKALADTYEVFFSLQGTLQKIIK